MDSISLVSSIINHFTLDMFPQNLYLNEASIKSSLPDPKCPQFWLGDYGYGKENVRVMALVKDGPYHGIREFNVSSHMKLATHKEYYNADNSDVIGSDVQKTNIFLHAKTNGLKTPEEFALSLAQHFLDTYPIVEASHVRVEEKPWERLYGKHTHAFTMTSTVKRFCDVIRKRSDPNPVVISGFDGLRIIKTSQAPIADRKMADLYTEDHQPEGVLCADVFAKWEYSTMDGVNFSTNWKQTKDLIVDAFAGNPIIGITTPSVQFIAYEAEKRILSEIPQISSVMITLPCIQYADFDFNRFANRNFKKRNVHIYQPSENPNEIGFAKLDRLAYQEKSKL